MYYRGIREPVEKLGVEAGVATEKIFADIFEHVPYEQLPHFGGSTAFALEDTCAELRAMVDAPKSWDAPVQIRNAINVGVGAVKPNLHMSAEGREIFNEHTTVADVSFSQRKVLLDGTSGLLNGVVEMNECRTQGTLNVGGRPVDVPPKSFFTVTLNRHETFNTDIGHMLRIGYDANTRELMHSSVMASHVDNDTCAHREDCTYELAVQEMPFAYLNPTPPGSVILGSILVRAQYLLRGQIDLSTPTQTEVEALTFRR